MLWFKVNEQLDVVAISEEYPAECKGWAVGMGPCPYGKKPIDENNLKAGFSYGAGWINRNDISEYPAAPLMLAQQIADSASKLMGVPYLATDAGDSVSPRYDVIKAPQIGDQVSRAFNGDYYPCGAVVAIQKNYRRIVVDGSERGRLIFARRKESGCWLNKGMWSLLPGVIKKLNPEF
jgi:hypothetical protein